MELNFKFFNGFGYFTSNRGNEITLNITGGYTVMANTRTLRASWSPEMVQDVNALYRIDFEGELNSILNQEYNQFIIKNFKFN